ncbi:hypothetical protein JK358_01845 [Nocardia sp. 2]|uniref:TY-Chap N-terminal domain-containing protein n=1 Tax=Nocardia acididurans TaxID=2802282 RepID=A0ABS1LY98_9NOCA|nr:DUF6301 family protein [Nocardia acididurans]MBL1073130.1 hypothetical protein [Nocardia acididurans]
MSFAVRVDIAGAVRIVKTAARFGWRWDSEDVRGFARQLGWAAPQPVGTMRRGALFSRTGLGVWWDSAMFWGTGDGLGHVRVTISDCLAPGEFGSAPLLDGALAKVAARFTELWGEPESGGAGPESGPAWVFPSVVAGLALGPTTVDLLLVSPAEQAYWRGRKYDAARARTDAGPWGRFTEDLADFLETLPDESILVLGALGGRYVQFATTEEQLLGELSRSEFVDPLWHFGPEVESVLMAAGWTPPRESNWWRTQPRRAGTPAASRFAVCAVAGLRALGVESPADLFADAWVEGGDDLDIAPLGIPLNSTSRSKRAEYLLHNAAYPFDSEPLRTDVPGGIEIARAAQAFEWSWTRADAERFADQTGWKPQRAPKPDGRTTWVQTGMRVDTPTAVCTFDGDRLESICVTLSDSIESHLYEDGLPEDVRAQLSAAFARLTDGFRSDLGQPVHGVLWHAHGPVWSSPNLMLGLVADTDTVDLFLVNPAERARRLIIEQQRFAHRAEDREWRQFIDDLAAVAAGLAEGAQLIIDSREHGFARLNRTERELAVELVGVTGPQPQPRVAEVMVRDGWRHPDEQRPRWRNALRLPALRRDFRWFMELVLWPLRTEMTPETELHVRVDGWDQGLRTPSIGASGP